MAVTIEQKEKSAELLKYLWINNEYFKNIIMSTGISKYEEIDYTTLKNMPISNKTTILESGQCYFSSTDDKTVIELTSGTTGVPFRCFKTINERNKLALELWKMRRKFDKKVSPEAFFQLMGVNDKFGIDFANFSDINVRKILCLINGRSPRWLCGSPTTIYHYCKCIENGKAGPVPSIQFVELQGEYVDRGVKKYIEDIMKCTVIQHYGNRECWTIAYQCLKGNMHTVESIVAEECDIGMSKRQIIVTSLTNTYMPIVRYETADIGNINYNQCDCGSEYPIVELEGGRKANLIKGYPLIGDIVFKKIVHNAINKDKIMFDIIRRYRITQNSYNIFTFHIDKGFDYSDEITEYLINGTKRALNQNDIEVKFDFEYEASRGKHKLFESEVQ